MSREHGYRIYDKGNGAILVVPPKGKAYYAVRESGKPLHQTTGEAADGLEEITDKIPQEVLDRIIK